MRVSWTTPVTVVVAICCGEKEVKGIQRIENTYIVIGTQVPWSQSQWDNNRKIIEYLPDKLFTRSCRSNVKRKNIGADRC